RRRWSGCRDGRVHGRRGLPELARQLLGDEHDIVGKVDIRLVELVAELDPNVLRPALDRIAEEAVADASRDRVLESFRPGHAWEGRRRVDGIAERLRAPLLETPWPVLDHLGRGKPLCQLVPLPKPGLD